MINDDILVKFSKNRIKEGHALLGNWVDYTRLLQDQLLYIILGFPGIGRNDLSLISNDSLQVGQRLILDANFDGNIGVIDTDIAAVMGVVLQYDPLTKVGLLEIEGIGQGTDFSRDPDRNLKWRDIIEIDFKDYPTILEVISKPRSDGGSVYYYFMKHNRDSRW